MKIKTNVNADGARARQQHQNDAAARAARKGLRVRTSVKCGGIKVPEGSDNHNQTVVSEAKKGLRVRTSVKCGGIKVPQGSDNHNQKVSNGIKVKSNLKAGTIVLED